MNEVKKPVCVLLEEAYRAFALGCVVTPNMVWLGPEEYKEFIEWRWAEPLRFACCGHCGEGGVYTYNDMEIKRSRDPGIVVGRCERLT